MRVVSVAVALAFSHALASSAAAQSAIGCSEYIEQVADLIPDISENPNAYEDLGLTEEQLEAVLATLDAARLIEGEDEEGCMNLAQAAVKVLERGGEVTVGG